MYRDVKLVRSIPLFALLLLWCAAFGLADAAVGQSPIEDSSFAISKELCATTTTNATSGQITTTQEDPCCTDPCSEECTDFSAKCDANCPGIDTDCCNAPCTVDCQDPAVKCDNNCQDIDPDCCTNPCSNACSNLNAKCTLCEDDVALCYAGCTSDIGVNPAVQNLRQDFERGTLLAPLPMQSFDLATSGCPSACADELDENDTLIYQACMAFWGGLIPFPEGLAVCDYCNLLPWPVSQICSQVCNETPLGCIDLKAALGDLVCCDIVQSTVVPYEVCWDFDHNKLCQETIAGCNNWYNRCTDCCDAHGRPNGGPCYQNCLYQRDLNPDSPCYGL